jgi:CubicO group peptidase (beta-lactamase class C family)
MVPLLVFVSPEGGGARVASGVSLLLLMWMWVRVYSGAHSGRLWDVVEAAALMTISIGLGDPTRAMGVFYIGLFFRTLYGSARVVALRAVLYGMAFWGALLTLGGPSTLLSEKALGATGIPMTAAIRRPRRPTAARPPPHPDFGGGKSGTNRGPLIEACQFPGALITFAENLWLRRQKPRHLRCGWASSRLRR